MKVYRFGIFSIGFYESESFKYMHLYRPDGTSFAGAVTPKSRVAFADKRKYVKKLDPDFELGNADMMQHRFYVSERLVLYFYIKHFRKM